MSAAFITAPESGAVAIAERREPAAVEWWRDPDVIHLWSPFVIFIVGAAVILALYVSGGVTGAVALTAFTALAAFLIGHHSASLGKVPAERRIGGDR
jgi:hypothetical protein